MSPGTRAVSETDARTKIVFVRTVELADYFNAAIDETLSSKNVVAQDTLRFGDRREVFPTKTEIYCQIWADLPVILDEERIGG